MNNIKSWIRLLLVLCTVGLVISLFVPMWSIDLNAPQYPEGLTLLIYPGKLAGDVDIVNGLNHYIGMKTLHANDFIEFTILPYILGAFAVLYLIAAIVGKRKFLYVVSGLFIAFCLIAMIDFWRWEYNYGHDLNPDAAIKVPGMAYQPPLLGYKQLLNFAAYSLPSTGGLMVFMVALISVFACFVEIRQGRINAKRFAKPLTMILLACSVFMTSCSTNPSPITAGTDQCNSCKMTISDAKFSSEIISKKGKIFKFDDMHCLRAFLNDKQLDTADVKAYYFTNFDDPKALLSLNKAFFFKSTDFKTPMGGNIAVFASESAIQKIQEHFAGTKLQWADVTSGTNQ